MALQVHEFHEEIQESKFGLEDLSLMSLDQLCRYFLHPEYYCNSNTYTLFIIYRLALELLAVLLIIKVYELFK